MFNVYCERYKYSLRRVYYITSALVFDIHLTSSLNRLSMDTLIFYSKYIDFQNTPDSISYLEDRVQDFYQDRES